MFNGQRWKIKLVYIGVGSLFGCLCTIIGMIASPATAQREKFQEIECTKLTLIDPSTVIRTAKLKTDEHGGFLELNGVKGNYGSVKFAVDENGGKLIMFSNEKAGEAHISVSLVTLPDGEGHVTVSHKNGSKTNISATENGGFVAVRGAKYDKILSIIGVTDNGESGLVGVHRYGHGKEIGAVQVSIDEFGGRLNVYGKDLVSVAGIRVDDDGGQVYTHAKHGKSYAVLGIDEHGGRVELRGKGEGGAAIGINEYGNGAVSTWDKNGYRQ